MLNVLATSQLRRVPALLGGSGLARPLPRRVLPALCQPKSCHGGYKGCASSRCASGGRP